MANKKMIIKGVGFLMAKDPNSGELLTLANLQNLKINLTVNLEDIFGGDGYFPIDTLVKDKSIEVTATDAKFDMNMIRLMMGSTLIEDSDVSAADAYVHVINEQTVLPFAAATPVTFDYDLVYGDAMFDTDMSVRVVGTNKYLKPAAGSVPASGEYLLTPAIGGAKAKITVLVDSVLSGASLAVNYKRVTTVDVVPLLANELPFPVAIVHHGSFQQKDGKYQGVETELYMCRAKGSLNLDFARATAAVNQISLEVLDPERADGRLGVIKRYEDTKQS